MLFIIDSHSPLAYTTLANSTNFFSHSASQTEKNMPENETKQIMSVQIQPPLRISFHSSSEWLVRVNFTAENGNYGVSLTESIQFKSVVVFTYNFVFLLFLN